MYQQPSNFNKICSTCSRRPEDPTALKWRSNSTQVMESITEELREKDKELIVSDSSDCAKTLGIHWHTTKDLLFVAIPTLDDKAPTKRSVASSAARLYGVLGWFAPNHPLHQDTSTATAYFSQRHHRVGQLEDNITTAGKTPHSQMLLLPIFYCQGGPTSRLL